LFENNREIVTIMAKRTRKRVSRKIGVRPEKKGRTENQSDISLIKGKRGNYAGGEKKKRDDSKNPWSMMDECNGSKGAIKN